MYFCRSVERLDLDLPERFGMAAVAVGLLVWDAALWSARAARKGAGPEKGESRRWEREEAARSYGREEGDGESLLMRAVVVLMDECSRCARV